uniref:Thioredoxin domain-containing protein n=1 Tax=Salix viminalis TaxID=40686 RepID=A0A6N2MKY0_SALVM
MKDNFPKTEIKAFHKGKNKSLVYNSQPKSGNLKWQYLKGRTREILDYTTYQNQLYPKEPAVIANPSPGCNGTLLVCGCCNNCHGGDEECAVQENYRKEFASRNVHLLTTMEKWNEKISEATNVVVNFSALWCAPCKTIAQAYCELADKYSSVIFLTVDQPEIDLDMKQAPCNTRKAQNRPS